MYLPHWVVNGQRTSSQIEAWRVATMSNDKPDFYFFDEEYDTLDNWSTSTNKFTAPEAGKYLFYAGAWSPGNTNNGDRYAFSATINGGAQNYITGGNYCSVDSPMSGYSVVLNLAQNDYVELYCFSAIATTIGGAGHKLFFGGYLLG